jgi:entry exclusion lipoprotein TrbK
MSNSKMRVLLAGVVAITLLSGCNRSVEFPSTPCDELDKTTDPAIKAELEQRCGRGGPEIKLAPPKTY